MKDDLPATFIAIKNSERKWIII